MLQSGVKGWCAPPTLEFGVISKYIWQANGNQSIENESMKMEVHARKQEVIYCMQAC